MSYEFHKSDFLELNQRFLGFPWLSFLLHVDPIPLVATLRCFIHHIAHQRIFYTIPVRVENPELAESWHFHWLLVLCLLISFSVCGMPSWAWTEFSSLIWNMESSVHAFHRGLSPVISGNSAQRISAQHVGLPWRKEMSLPFDGREQQITLDHFSPICNTWHTNTGNGWKTWYLGNWTLFKCKNWGRC